MRREKCMHIMPRMFNMVAIRRALDWTISFIHNLYIPLIATSNTALLLIYTLYESLGHANFSHSSLVLSWQRIHNYLTVTAAYYKVFFAQCNSFLAISSQLFCRLPTPETLSFLCGNCQLRNSTDLNDLPCPPYNPSARASQKAQLFYCRVCLFTRKCLYSVVSQQRLYVSNLLSWYLL
jgi:hypothetical protein